jgi:hypothetical protein
MDRVLKAPTSASPELSPRSKSYSTAFRSSKAVAVCEEISLLGASAQSQ